MVFISNLFPFFVNKCTVHLVFSAQHKKNSLFPSVSLMCICVFNRKLLIVGKWHVSCLMMGMKITIIKCSAMCVIWFALYIMLNGVLIVQQKCIRIEMAFRIYTDVIILVSITISRLNNNNQHY